METLWKLQTNFKITYILIIGILMFLLAHFLNNRSIYNIPKSEYELIQNILNDTTSIQQDGVVYYRLMIKQPYHYDSIREWKDIHR